MTAPELSALRQLRDCGVLRVRFDSDAFEKLVELRLAIVLNMAEGVRDYFITPTGAICAKAVL